MAATYRRVTMKALAKYQIILLGEQRHIGVNNLPKVVARQCSGRESNPRPADRESSALTTTPPNHQVVYLCLIKHALILTVHPPPSVSMSQYTCLGSRSLWTHTMYFPLSHCGSFILMSAQSRGLKPPGVLQIDSSLEG